MKPLLSMPFLLAAAVALAVPPAQSETLSDSLKVADCEFIIRYKSRKLDVLRQMITLRAVSETKTEQGNSKGAAGYRAYHLEFCYEGDYIRSRVFLRVDFKNAKGQRLHTIWMLPDERHMNESGDRPLSLERKSRYFAISLENVPLLLLDDVAEIAIEDNRNP